MGAVASGVTTRDFSFSADFGTDLRGGMMSYTNMIVNGQEKGILGSPRPGFGIAESTDSWCAGTES